MSHRWKVLFAAVLAAGLSPTALGAPPAKGRFQPDPDLPPDLGVPYVIVTSEELAPVFRRLAEWKRSTGMPAQVVTVEWLQRSAYYPGVDLPERLYRLLQDLRLNWRTRWVLLGGGVDAVPTQRIRAYKQALGGNQIACDVYYADVLPEERDDPDRIGAYGWNGNGDRHIGEADRDGFDLVEDLCVGRVPAETLEEAEAFLDKYLAYVHAKDKDTAWCSRALVVGARQFEQRQDEVAKLFRELGGDGYAAELVVERKPQPIQAISDELNKGYAFFDFFCHGCPAHFWACDDHTSWGVNQVKVLRNEGRYPVVFANSCDTNEFEKDVCLGSLMVLQPKAGGIAYVGYSHLSFGSDVNHQIWRRLFSGDCPELGRAVVEAKRAVEQDVWVRQVLQLLGDPEMWVRTGAPFAPAISGERLAVNVPARVTVADALGKPVRRARVFVEGAGVFLVGLTDESGIAHLPAPGRPGPVRIGVLAQNGRPSEKKALVLSKTPADALAVARPLLAIDDAANEAGDEVAEEAPEQPPAKAEDDGGITEDGSGEAPEDQPPAVAPRADEGATRLRGNAMKDLNPGETVRFVFSWPKDAPLPGGELTLEFEDDPFVKAVAGPERVEGGAAFRVHATRRTPAWHQAWATLRWKAQGEAWAWTYRQPVEGPSLTCVAVAVDDADGNRDKRIGWEDAGKRIRFSVGLYNGGTQAATGVKVVATTSDPAVTLLKDAVSLGAVALEEVAHPNRTFEFQLAPDYDGHAITFGLAIEDARKNRWAGRLQFTTPPAPPILLVAEAGVRHVTLSWTPGGSDGVVGYHVYRAASARGPWTRLTERPLRGAMRFPDATVKPATEYAYAVTSVTADGLESRHSAPVAAVTLSKLPKRRDAAK